MKIILYNDSNNGNDNNNNNNNNNSIILYRYLMHAAVGPNPMLGLGQLGHRPGPGQGPGHQDTIDFSRLQDAFKQVI